MHEPVKDCDLLRLGSGFCVHFNEKPREYLHLAVRNRTHLLSQSLWYRFRLLSSSSVAKAEEDIRRNRHTFFKAQPPVLARRLDALVYHPVSFKRFDGRENQIRTVTMKALVSYTAKDTEVTCSMPQQ